MAWSSLLKVPLVLLQLLELLEWELQSEESPFRAVLLISYTIFAISPSPPGLRLPFGKKRKLD